LAELRDRLGKVDLWKKRKAEIDEELNKVWVRGEEGGKGAVLEPPEYIERGRGDGDEEALESASASASVSEEEEEEEEEEGEVSSRDMTPSEQ
jgi:ATP-binding cassette subfamily D (ALD) long-chain fatty acid import protein